MSTLNIQGAALGDDLMSILMADTIEPGTEPSYNLCRALYVSHPLGAKMAELPIQIAQSQEREIAVQNGPEEIVRDAFLKSWKALNCDTHIFNVMRLARVFGIASVAMVSDGTPPDRPLDYKALPDERFAFNVLDPLNTAGSLVLNQDPNSLDFQKPDAIRVMGKLYHPSRTVTMLNESPVYLVYTTSAYGYVGRSVYQRVLYPLKSFVRTMIADEFVALKAGVLVAKQKAAGSIIDNVMGVMAGIKRAFVKEAQTFNVLSIGTEEEIESLNLQNLDGALKQSRQNIIENIASGTPMPAKLLTQESFALGFGEGSEDAKQIAQYVDRIRIQAEPLYGYFTNICQYHAWNPRFYETVVARFPDYKSKGYAQAFYEWRNSFEAKWPSLLKEPDSELIKVDDVKLKAIIAVVEIAMPALDPENRATLLAWLADCINEQKLLFASPLELDFDALMDYQPPQKDIGELTEPHESRPFAANDSERLQRAKADLTAAVSRLPQRSPTRARLALLSQAAR